MVRVLFPFGVPRQCAGEARGRRLDLGAADRERVDAFAIQPQLELMRIGKAAHRVVQRLLQVDGDRVVAIRRKVVADHGAAAGTERQAFVRPIVLHQASRQGIGLDCRNRRRAADGH